MVHRTKIFDGKTFKSQDIYSTKSAATKHATRLRKTGKLYVRVTTDKVRFPDETKTYYRVWTCWKKYSPGGRI